MNHCFEPEPDSIQPFRIDYDHGGDGDAENDVEGDDDDSDDNDDNDNGEDKNDGDVVTLALNSLKFSPW